MDLSALQHRLEEILGRWEKRLEAAVAAWERLPPAEQRRREEALDRRGEADEWVVVLFHWWQGFPPAEQARLADDIGLVAPVLRAARARGFLAGDDDRTAAARHLLEALERMEGILGPAP